MYASPLKPAERDSQLIQDDVRVQFRKVRQRFEYLPLEDDFWQTVGMCSRRRPSPIVTFRKPSARVRGER